jgi:hypothetical protein
MPAVSSQGDAVCPKSKMDDLMDEWVFPVLIVLLGQGLTQQRVVGNGNIQNMDLASVPQSLVQRRTVIGGH